MVVSFLVVYDFVAFFGLPPFFAGVVAGVVPTFPYVPSVPSVPVLVPVVSEAVVVS